MIISGREYIADISREDEVVEEQVVED